MKFDSRYFLKWISIKEPIPGGLDFFLIDHCLLSVVGRDQCVFGITVFEPRNLNEEFMGRLKKRLESPELTSCEFHFYIPAFLKHRMEILVEKSGLKSINTHYTSYFRVRHAAGTIVVQSQLRIFNVDDSPVLLKVLKHALDETGFTQIVGQTSDSTSAVDKIRAARPDVVTMDIQMPNKNGVEVVRDLLAKDDFPVIMVSSLELEEGSLVMEALHAGAFDYLQKPKIEDREQFKKELVEKILLAVEGRQAHSALKKLSKKKAPKATFSFQQGYSPNLIWCMGASTGGTQALTRVMTSLPDQIPPTLIVQHIPPVFSKSFADSLNALCPFEVKEAVDGEAILPNHVYIAKGGLQMGLEAKGAKQHITLRDVEPVNRFKPSVDYLFKEVAKISGLQIVAGILTGMGKDGAEGLLELKKKGARTFAQDEASSAVYGMPRAAFEIGATDAQLPLDSVAQFLVEKSAWKKGAA